MPVFLDHTIVPSTDRERSARFYTEVLGLPEAELEEPFLVVHLANDASLAFGGWDEVVHSQHYAFLMTEDEFDAFYARLQERGTEHWADAHCRIPGEVNHDDGGRGTYFRDPDGNFLEVITVRYGARPLTVRPASLVE